MQTNSRLKKLLTLSTPSAQKDFNPKPKKIQTSILMEDQKTTDLKHLRLKKILTQSPKRLKLQSLWDSKPRFNNKPKIKVL